MGVALEHNKSIMGFEIEKTRTFIKVHGHCIRTIRKCIRFQHPINDFEISEEAIHQENFQLMIECLGRNQRFGLAKTFFQKFRGRRVSSGGRKETTIEAN